MRASYGDPELFSTINIYLSTIFCRDYNSVENSKIKIFQTDRLKTLYEMRCGAKYSEKQFPRVSLKIKSRGLIFGRRFQK